MTKEGDRLFLTGRAGTAGTHLGKRLVGEPVELATFRIAFDPGVEARAASNSSNQRRKRASSSGGSLATAFSMSSTVLMRL
jgi:hypothetical protein